ncbi:MAG TPA: type II toxin-antitoxin system RelE/ParE family toxin [Bryobacteraceae bacterium]|jgi:hypothetical protein|nr:type II toxin-antitoxin system RelE/ParE family toxin [Bryobacteraceae bacterium]
MQSCVRLLLGPKRARSTPTLAVGSSNSGSPDRVRERSKGYRTIILFRRGVKAFFEYGFSKSQRANINNDEETRFKEAAKHVLALTEKQLAELLKRGDFVEVKSE